MSLAALSEALEKEGQRRQRKIEAGQRMVQAAEDAAPFSRETLKLIEMVEAFQQGTLRATQTSGIDPDFEVALTKELIELRQKIERMVQK